MAPNLYPVRKDEDDVKLFTVTKLEKRKSDMIARTIELNQSEKAILSANLSEQLILQDDQSDGISDLKSTKDINQSDNKNGVKSPPPSNQPQRLQCKQKEPDWSGFKCWLHSVAVVTFDLELGQVIEKTFPNHEEFRELAC